MAGKVRVRSLRPLNGEAEGKILYYDAGDAERLERAGAVKILGKAERSSPATKAEGESPANKSAGKRRRKA